MVPSCATAGELKMMSPVAYDHLSVPSRATSYSLPSCEPTSTEPSAATAGDDTIGPPVANVHQTAGFTAGSTNGERPRWVGPKRNIACAGSIAYCGKRHRRSAQPARRHRRAGGVARPHAAARVAQPIELAVLVRRARRRLDVGAARRGTTTAATAARRRAATSVTVTRRPACVGPVKAEPGTRGARTAREPGETRPATDMEFGWRKVKANWKTLQDRLIALGRACGEAPRCLLACALPAAGLALPSQGRQARAAQRPARRRATGPAAGRAAPRPAAAAAGAAGRAAIRHVVIISEDGLRPDALTGVRPPVHEAILKRAAPTRCRRARSAARRRCRRTPRCCRGSTSRSTACTGTRGSPSAATSTCRRSSTPPDRAAASAAAFVGKRKLEHIAHPGSVDVVLAARLLLQEGRRRGDRATSSRRSPRSSSFTSPIPTTSATPTAGCRTRSSRPSASTDKCLATLLDAVVGRRPRSRDAVHHLGRPRRPRPQPRRQDRGGPPDPLDRVGPRHPRRPPHRRPTSAPSTPPPPRSGSSATRPPGSVGRPVSKPSKPNLSRRSHDVEARRRRDASRNYRPALARSASYCRGR